MHSASPVRFLRPWMGIISILTLFVGSVGAQEKIVPDFEEVIFEIEPFGMSQFAQGERIQLDDRGRCAYKVAPLEARPNVEARTGAYFRHQLSPKLLSNFNALLRATEWLRADGAEGRAIHTHPATVRITLKREGKERMVTCLGNRPEPYRALLHAIHGLATQERRIYLHNHVRGDVGKRAWETTGREIASFRGDPTGTPPYAIDYTRYLPIAERYVSRHYGRSDSELITAVRLVGHFRRGSDLKYLHRMAHDRSSSNLRSDVAWALAQIHDASSLPVLADMVASPTERAGDVLIHWGEAAIPHIVGLIRQSTDPASNEADRVAGEKMIRAYLEHWDWKNPVGRKVVSAVEDALNTKDPANGMIRTTYHKEFLKKAAN